MNLLMITNILIGITIGFGCLELSFHSILAQISKFLLKGIYKSEFAASPHCDVIENDSFLTEFIQSSRNNLNTIDRHQSNPIDNSIDRLNKIFKR